VTTTTLAYIPSPSQGVWHLGPFPIRAYALFIIVGIIVALVIGDRRWEARGGERGVIYDIALWAVPFGLIGGRLYHVITDWQTYFGDGGAGFVAALRIWDGGLGIWGAVGLGGLGAWIGCRHRGIPLPAFGDAIAPGIVLAQAIGRLGNYFNQELYGRPTTLPWGLEIYERRDASGALDYLNGVSTGQLVEVVHPTFLYELLWNLLVFAVLIWVDRRFKIGHGRLFALYVAGYCLGRFWIELMRSDVATHIAGIRINSFTSMFVFIGAVVYIMAAPRGREDPSTLRGEPEGVEQDTAVEDFVKELTAVASTTGVVAAAKAAGEADDEDAKAVSDEPESEAAAEAETLTFDVIDVPDEDIEEDDVEAAAEAEALAEDVANASSEEIAEAQEFAAAAEEAEAAEAEAIADVVAAEAESATDPSAAPAEGHPVAEAEAAVEAEALADEVAAEDAVLAAGADAHEMGEAEVSAEEAHEAAAEAEPMAEGVADEESKAAAEPEESTDEVSETPADKNAEPEQSLVRRLERRWRRRRNG
jgi:prolipoprotein diacylglyceryl transferase